MRYRSQEEIANFLKFTNRQSIFGFQCAVFLFLICFHNLLSHFQNHNPVFIPLDLCGIAPLRNLPGRPADLFFSVIQTPHHE